MLPLCKDAQTSVSRNLNVPRPMSSFMFLFITKGTTSDVVKFKEMDWIIKFSSNKMYLQWLSYFFKYHHVHQEELLLQKLQCFQYPILSHQQLTVLCRKQLSKPCSKKQTFSTRDKMVSSWVVSAIFNLHYKSTSDGVRHSMKIRKNDGEKNRRIFKGRFYAIQGRKDRLQILQGVFRNYCSLLQLLHICFPDCVMVLTGRKKPAHPTHTHSALHRTTRTGWLLFRGG